VHFKRVSLRLPKESDTPKEEDDGREQFATTRHPERRAFD